MSFAGPSPVSEFYSRKSVFITGGTGFLGKVLVEKLLYSCPDIDKIYLLVRTGKFNKQQRVEQLIKSAVFTRLKAERPQQLSKIKALAGDVCSPKLGLKAEDEKVLLEQVSVVFHSAATVKFNETLRVALRINVEGTRNVLELSQRMKKIEAFVHMSTAYAQLNKLVVEEVVYPPPAKLQHVYEFLDKHEHDQKKVDKLMKGFPNTYTYSKALAETLLVERRGRIPLVIIRPSIVMPAISEPMEGWVDTTQGAGVILTAIAKGWMRVILGTDAIVADLIPVDYVTNMAIIAAFKCAGSSDVEIFHCCTSGVNPVRWRETSTFYLKEGIKTGFNELPCPGVLTIKRLKMVALASFLFEKLPAYCLDLSQIVRGQKTRYVRFQKKIETLRTAVHMFSSTNWRFRSERAQALVQGLPPAARRLFPCHPADIQWRPYIETCQRGMAAYLLRKSNSNSNRQ